MERMSWRARSAVMIAISTVAVGAVRTACGQIDNTPQVSATSLDGMSLDRVFMPQFGRGVSVLPIDAPPINGFIPQVVVGLTDQRQFSNDIVGYGVHSEGPGGSTLPAGGPPHYLIATLDSGSQAHIFTYDDAQVFNFPGANRDGTKVQSVQGANG